MISSKNLAKALYRISEETSFGSDDILRSFMSYVDEYNLHSLMPKTIQYLEEFHKKDEKWKTVEIEFGYKIEDLEIIKNIKETIKAKINDHVLVIENKELIGGFVAKHKGVIYDASINHQLQLLKKNLINS